MCCIDSESMLDDFTNLAAIILFSEFSLLMAWINKWGLQTVEAYYVDKPEVFTDSSHLFLGYDNIIKAVASGPASPVLPDHFQPLGILQKIEIL